MPADHFVERLLKIFYFQRSVDMQRAEAAVPAAALEQEPTAEAIGSLSATSRVENGAAAGPNPYRGLLFLSAGSVEELKNKLSGTLEDVKQGNLPPSLIPNAEALAKRERIAIDYSDAADLAQKCDKALKAIEAHQPGVWFSCARFVFMDRIGRKTRPKRHF